MEGAYVSAMSAQAESATAAGWEADLWSMHAPPGGASRCLCVHLLWPCAAGEIAARVDAGPPHSARARYCVDAVCGGVFGCFFCFYCLPWALTRSRLRARDGIDGSCAEDLLVTLCLPPCYLAQALNHLDTRDAARAAAAQAAGSPAAAWRSRAQLAQTPTAAGGAGYAPPGVVMPMVMAATPTQPPQ